jgi:hypothetical protein
LPTRPANKDDPGGDTITVMVYRNGILELSRECVLQSSKGVRVYKVDDDDLLRVGKKSTPSEIASLLLKNKGER